MTGNRVGARRARTRNKALALTASGVVLAAAVTVPSLAAWTDQEWVHGGAGAGLPDGEGGVTASTFEVEQFADGDADFDHYETDGGANVINFGAQAAALTPGDTVYAYVRLRTVENSLGGTLTLAALTAVVDGEFSDALRYGARIVPDVASCSADDYAGAGSTVLQASGTPLDQAAPTATFSLDASVGGAPGAEKVVCFELDFPDTEAANTALAESSPVVPIWRFDAVSVAS